ncbi:hypothetical protein [Nonomuraea endophytica]|uniref:Uncharacterized protein n=1 Tax=Nonomuraea endophytica TaxID=714136 RepID=A0A7W8AA11_9ACTN|nr:hypothetical protein [Nonomuraea endophytica]MBB5082333.1 hypothetical protein [Nonomuraea endophytica]
MLKEVSAVSALVAAVLLPSSDVQAQVTTTTTATSSPCGTALSFAPKCQWFEKKDRRCLYCKQKKKGGGWKKKYCEDSKKTPEDTGTINCDNVKSPTADRPNRTCRVCQNEKTGKVISRDCFG